MVKSWLAQSKRASYRLRNRTGDKLAAKSTPLAVKVAIYQRLLSGDIARDVGRMYVISMPTVLKYANDAVAELRLLEAVELSHPGGLLKPHR